MKTHNIPLESFISTGKVNNVMENGELSLTSINLSNRIYIPSKFKLPFRIEMTLKADSSAFKLKVGKGGIYFSGHINISGGGINRTDILTGKKETAKFDYDNEFPLNKYFDLAVIYADEMTWIEINGNYCYHTKKAPYIDLLKNNSLPDEFKDGLDLSLNLGKYNVGLKIKSFSVTEYKNGEINIPAKIANLSELSSFEWYLKSLPNELRAEEDKTDEHGKKRQKFIMQIDEYQLEPHRRKTGHGTIRYILPGKFQYTKQEIEVDGQTQVKWLKSSLYKQDYAPKLSILNIIDVHKTEDYKIGGIISFGNYYWRILDVKNNTALIITEEITEQRPYHDAYEDITWADCALRKYLNGEFYSHFSEAEKKRIMTVTNKNLDNLWYGTKGGEDTLDKIFILSLEEAVCKYFGDSSALYYNPGKNQKYWFERKDINNEKRGALYKGSHWWYWLRTPGRVNKKAVYCGDGGIGIQGNNILKSNIAEDNVHLFGNNHGGVRPALWLKLN